MRKGCIVPKYLLLSIPLAAAVIVGLIAYQATLSSLDPPSEEEIKAAPSWEETKKRLMSQPRGPSFDPKRLEEALRRMKEEGPPKVHPDTTKDATIRESPRRKPRVAMDAGATWREKLQKERHNAILRAKRAGALWGIVTGVLGYAALGVYFYRLGRKQPKESWRDVMSRGDRPVSGDTTSHETKTYADKAAEQTPQHIGDEEPPYEPYEPPIHISELEKAYEQGREKPQS